jgi:hypothetical protein
MNQNQIAKKRINGAPKMLQTDNGSDFWYAYNFIKEIKHLN